MKITEVAPEPAPLPPPTFTVSGLTKKEVDLIRTTLFGRACDEVSPRTRAAVQKLHGEWWAAQHGGAEYHGDYTPWPPR